MNRALLLTSAFLIGVGPLGARKVRPRSEPSLRRTITLLKRIQPPNTDSPTDLPLMAQRLLPVLKHHLRDLIIKTLNSPGFENAKPPQIRRGLVEKLQTQGIGVGNNAQSGLYGGVLDVQIEHPAGHANLLAATTRLQIPCGSDESLYLFRRVHGRWTLILPVESAPYARIDGAQGMFDYAVSPADPQGGFFALAASITPWCTSNWHEIRYKLLEPGTPPTKPKVLFSHENGAYIGGDQAYRLATERGGFRVSYIGANSLDSAILLRVHVDRYKVSAQGIARVPPIAYLPQDFLDEWVNLPWDEAARWTHSNHLDQIRNWHQRLLMENSSDQHSYYKGLNFVQPCPNAAMEKWQIGLSIDPEKRPDKLLSELFFTVVKKNRVFSLERIDTTRPPGCPGHAYAVDTLDFELLDKLLNR